MADPFGGRGGEAHDEGLLKELMAISNKSNCRFDDEDNNNSDGTNDNTTEMITEDETRPVSASTASFATANEFASPASAAAPNTFDTNVIHEDGYESDSNFLPNSNDYTSVHDADSNTGFQHDNNNNFQGKNGGSAQDEELLKELMAISNKRNRFNDDADSGEMDTEAPDNENVILTATPKGENIESTIANDNENQSALPANLVREENRRFFPSDIGSGEETKDAEADDHIVKSNQQPVKPWHKKKNKACISSDVDVVVAVPPPKVAETRESTDVPNETVSNDVNKFQSKDNLPKTFKGDRGGAAEDAELLAELRAISNKSTNRFNEEDEGIARQHPVNNDELNPKADQVDKKKSPSKLEAAANEPSQLKPWQRKKKKASVSNNVDVVVAAPKMTDVDVVIAASPPKIAHAPTQVETVSNDGKKFQSNDNLPKTFKGDRGGAAEDAELLAELRAISNKSTNRFNDEASTTMQETVVHNEDNAMNAVDSSGNEENLKVDQVDDKKSPAKLEVTANEPSQLKPWQKKKNASVSTNADVDVVVAAPKMTDVDVVIAASPPKVAGATIESSSLSAETVSNDVNQFQSNDNLPKTFKGDRGGAAEDAELLAELRAISNKSTNRFNDEASTTMQETVVHNGDNAMKAVASSANKENLKVDKVGDKKLPAKLEVTVNEPSQLKPWQRKKKKATVSTNADVDVVVAAPKMTDVDVVIAASPPKVAGATIESSSLSVETVSNDVKKFQSNDNLPKTFKGDRGGAAEDAELLAELRAISNKSTNRFNDEASTTVQEKAVDNSDSGVNKFNDEDEVIQQKKTSDLKEENLKVDKVDDKKAPAAIEPPQLKPWQRRKKKASVSTDVDVDVVVAAPTMTDVVIAASPPKVAGATIESSSLSAETLSNDVSQFQPNDNLPKTFKGDRGGAAEDAELLAELRAISNRGAITREQPVDNDEQNLKVDPANNNTGSQVEAAAKEISELKPWQRNKKKASVSPNVNVVVVTPKMTDIDVVIADTPPSVASPPIKALQHSTSDDVGKFQSNDNLPKTFKGDRGGAAEDAGLLAELRAISSKGSYRFNDEANDTGQEKTVDGEHNAMKAVASSANAASDSSSKPLKPWQTKKTQNNNVVLEAATALNPFQNAMIDPSNPGGASFKSSDNLPQTFKGDRGGAAEDAELLAELRAISSKSSKDRFVEGIVDPNQSDQKYPDDPNTSSHRTPHIAAPPPTPNANESLADALPPGSTAPSPEVNVTLDNLTDSIKSSNWQLRKGSYSFLSARIMSMLSSKKAMNQLDEDDVYSSLNVAVCKALNEKIAGAHDAALTLSITYTDSCKEACTGESLKNIASALLKGPAFSSSRKTTMALVEDLALKVIEVSPTSESIQTTCDLIQQHGLKSKKPKVVLFSAMLVHRLVREFGVGAFPVLALSNQSEILISNSNNEVREVGMKIASELCITLGSKEALQPLVDKMKPAQQLQLDNLLSKSTPTKPTRSLRYQGSLSSPEDIQAAMKRQEEEAKAHNFASRPVVNLFQVLPTTCYNEKIKLDKWSEKVAALDALIKAAGEQPFKLSPPSSSVNYVPLIRDLSKLLGHTHFAVVSKALESIGMLAEGVGEDLYPNFRPLVPNLVGLFKDKKVCKAVASCLDKMYGNILSFGHLLDEIPSSLDEKAQKNSLVRSSALDYLGRCVSANERRGKRGELTPEYASGLSRLAILKLDDSDAATRKAASSLLVVLLKYDDSAIAVVAKESIAPLQKSHPRVFKSLDQAIKGSPPSSINKTNSRPMTAPTKPPTRKNESARPKTAAVANSKQTSIQPVSGITGADDTVKLVSLEESIGHLSTLSIPNWSDDIDNDGILIGIQCELNSIAIAYNFMSRH
eukprot:scaffold25343_cov68-Cyclotella_meneghiniana.AAC.6